MNKRMLYNYHSHTKRCGHAFGEDEEYVLSAIKMGLKVFGFSDHVMVPNIQEPKVRGDYSQINDYFSSVKYLKEKYKDQIEILLGFEAEYSLCVEEYYRDLLNGKVDFLILGQHNYYENNQAINYFTKDAPIGRVRKYVDDVIAGIDSGLFKYLCHPDLFMYSQNEWNEELEKEGRRLLKHCEEKNFPVELNICGMRRPTFDGEHYSYPNKDFYSLIKDYKLQIVLGIDAHDPSHYNNEDVEKALKFAEECGFEVDLDYQI